MNKSADNNLLARLDTATTALLARVAAIAAVRGVAVWLVGGSVRDVLIGRPLDRDIDLAVSADTPGLAGALVAALAGRITAQHADFGTATIELPQAVLDLAQTRRETYPRPAALPVVAPADIEADLARRDFTINALAVELQSSGTALLPAPLLDPFGGQADLAAGLLRVLHPASFRDDPTRILRGVRLAARLELQLTPATAGLLTEALAGQYLAATTPDRLRNELCLALAEPDPAAVLRRADAWHLTPQLVPGLHWTPALADRWRCAATITVPVERDLLTAGLLLYDLPAETQQALVARYRLPAPAARLLGELAPARAAATALTPLLPNSTVDQVLGRFSPLTLAVLACGAASPASTIVAHYLHELRPITPLLDGHALQALGVSRGPRIGQLLAALRAAQLDGKVTTSAEAEAFVRSLIG